MVFVMFYTFLHVFKPRSDPGQSVRYRTYLSMQELSVCSGKLVELKMDRSVSVSWPSCLLEMELRQVGSEHQYKMTRCCLRQK